jgi:hypothetical protein
MVAPRQIVPDDEQRAARRHGAQQGADRVVPGRLAQRGVMDGDEVVALRGRLLRDVGAHGRHGDAGVGRDLAHPVQCNL